MVEHNKLGREGEAVATAYLKEKGYTILAVNWRFYRYELDIVAQTADELVVVEVKSRSANHLVHPEDAVSARKIRFLVAGADMFVKQNNVSWPVRFDILTVVKEQNGYSINHIEDAFYPPVW